MRFTLSPEQKKFFVHKGYIAFDDIPLKEKEMAQLVAELTDRHPLRIAWKKELSSWPEVPTPFDYENDCGVLISQKEGWGIFYTFGFPKIAQIYPEHEGTFLFYLFTKRFLDPERYPVIYK